MYNNRLRISSKFFAGLKFVQASIKKIGRIVLKKNDSDHKRTESALFHPFIRGITHQNDGSIVKSGFDNEIAALHWLLSATAFKPVDSDVLPKRAINVSVQLHSDHYQKVNLADIGEESSPVRSD